MFRNFFIFFHLIFLISICKAQQSNLFLDAYYKIEKGDSAAFYLLIKKNPSENNFARYLCLAALSEQNHKFKDALGYYEQAIQSSQNNFEKAFSYVKTGSCFANNDIYTQAVKYLHEAEKLYNFPDTTKEFTDLNRHLANADLYLGNKQEGVRRYIKIYQAAVKSKNKLLASLTSNNIAITYIDLKQFTEGKKFLDISFELRKAENDTFRLGQTYNNYGTYYFETGDIQKALSFYQKGYAYRKKSGNCSAIAESEVNIGKSYLKIGKKADAKNILEYAFNDAGNCGNLVIKKRASELLKNIYLNEGNFEQAYKMLDTYHMVKDSFFGLEKKNEINKLSLEATFQKKMYNDSLAIETHKQEIRVKEEKNKQNRILLLVLLIVLLLIAFIGYTFYKNSKKEHHINLVITQQTEELKARHKEVKDSIDYAQNLQNALLPSADYFENNFSEHFILYQPKDGVSGDFYWACETHDNNNQYKTLFFALGDCTGHGVPGAMVSVLGINSLSRCITEFKRSQPAVILNKLSEIIIETFTHNQKSLSDGMDISLCAFEFYAKKDTQEEAGVLRWSGANNSLLLIRNGEMTELSGTRRPVGFYNGNLAFEQKEIMLKKGDNIYLYTDGYYDQFGGQSTASSGKKYKQKNLKQYILSIHHLPMQEQNKLLIENFRQWKEGFVQIDDVSVIGFRI